MHRWKLEISIEQITKIQYESIILIILTVFCVYTLGNIITGSYGLLIKPYRTNSFDINGDIQPVYKSLISDWKVEEAAHSIHSPLMNVLPLMPKLLHHLTKNKAYLE